MTAAVLFVTIPLLPLLLAPLLLAPPLLAGGRRLLPLAPWVPLTALGLLPFHPDIVELPWLLLGTRLGIDPLALPLVLLAIVVWTLAGWHARVNLDPAEQPRFFFFWLLTWCGNLCVFLTLDGASFYAAYALMTFAAYGLVVHRGRPADFRAGRMYLWMAVFGEAALIAALILIGIELGNPPLELGPEMVAGTVRAPLIAVLVLLGFGVKVGLAGLHMWLPLAHPQAPVAASAVLSGVILKAGLIGWLRFLPLGHPGFEWLGTGLFALGMATALLGVVVGLTQTRFKALLAYSSVSQMGLLAMIVALALIDSAQGVLFAGLATLFALHHGLAKAALFMGADLIRYSPHLARLLLWLPAAALTGLPLTTGALAKANLKTAIPAELSIWLIVSSIATTLLMARLLAMIWRDTARPGSRPQWPWLSLLAGSLTLPWLFAGYASPDLVRLPFRLEYLRETAAPVALGALLALAGAALLRRRTIPEIPAGDLLALLPRHRPPFTVPESPRQLLPRQELPPRPLARNGFLVRIENELSTLATALLAGAALLVLLFLG